MEDDYKLISEEDDTIEDKYTIIYEFSLKEDIEDFTKDIDVTKDPFIVLISGMDNAGDITSITRSDVNIVVVVNPKTYQILMIHIPRDYYVKLHGQENRDKLTHSGLYGTEMTVKTIEDLLQIDINYYFKVNFMSVVDIVNALGGVDVYSKYTFRTVDYDYYFEKGYNRINGKQALEFVRTRKVLKGGDRARGENQQALIQAVVKKATSPAILTKYSSLLESVNGKFITNLSSEKMLQIIKLQIDKMPKWNFTSISLDGFDSENYSSVFPTIKKYVMEPDQKTIDAAMEAIKDVFDGKILDSSYQENTSGWVNTPHVYVPPKEEPEEEEPDENLEEENPDLEDDPNLDEEGNPIDPNNPTTDPDNPTEPTPGETSPDPTDPNPGNPDGGDSSGTGSGSTTGSETTPPGTEAETSGNTNTGTDSSTSSKNNP